MARIAHAPSHHPPVPASRPTGRGKNEEDEGAAVDRLSGCKPTQPLGRNCGPKEHLHKLHNLFIARDESAYIRPRGHGTPLRAKSARRPAQSECPASRPQTEITGSRLRDAYGGLRPKIESTGCVRRGLPCFNLGGPAEWRGQVSGRPSRACSRVVSLLSDCAHRETARPERSLVHSSSGRKHAGRENRAGSRKDWTTRLPCSDDRARSSLVA